ncbi:hypothetical protein CL614_02785 [archaeon]|nr:hypothetical protein [archaeon]
MGVGSAYLNLQSYGMTLVGVLVAAGGGLGLYISKTTNGKLISGGVVLGGVGLMLLASKIRSKVNTAQTEGSGGFEGVGKVFLGLAVLGVITKGIGSASADSPPFGLNKKRWLSKLLTRPGGGNDGKNEEPDETDSTNGETDSTNGNGE